MPTYIALLKWTPQGLQNIKQSPSRLDSARRGFEAAGVRMKDFYMVTGQYDMVAVVEAPDDVALAKAILAAAAQGSITTETCRAFNEDGVPPDRNRVAITSGRVQRFSRWQVNGCGHSVQTADFTVTRPLQR
jgi:uncharacterized protein with GYD domain